MADIEANLWWIILLPLAGAAVNGLLGRRLGRQNVGLIAIAVMAAAFLLSIFAFVEAIEQPLHSVAGTWFHVGDLLVSWGLYVDRLSGTLLLVVTGVGLLIHIYSTSYMSHEDEAGFARFFAYLNLFVAAMLVLVMGDSLVLTFVGWEGVGLCSYLLIGFWYTDAEKAYAGRKAFVTNRIGDFGFLIGLFALLSIFGTPSYAGLADKSQGLALGAVIQGGAFAGWTVESALTFACIGLFVGCAGKSAQLPLYVWLPDAMAGPTPVSALIHAATMVTAGVYLVARTSFLFALAPAAMATVTLVGALTALFAALIAFTQTDIKKVLAYSTVSQLGFMFIGVGSGAFYAGILLLVTHAFFKACLFLGAGSVMHGMGDDTDIRHMGGLRKKMPATAATFLVSTLAITGIVPLSGFFAKDAILAGAFASYNARALWVGQTAYAIGSLAALGTAFYMMRLYYLTFGGKPRTPAAEHAHESSPAMTWPLWILAGLSVVGTVLGLPKLEFLHSWGEIFARFLDESVFKQANAILEARAHEALLARGVEPLPEAVHLWPFFVALAIALIGFAVARAFYAGKLQAVPADLARRFGRTYRFAYDKFRVDELYDVAVIRPIQLLARTLWRVVDVGIIEGVFVNGIPRALAASSGVIRKAQNGDVQRYAAVIAVAAAVILWIVLGLGGH